MHIIKMTLALCCLSVLVPVGIIMFLLVIDTVLKFLKGE